MIFEKVVRLDLSALIDHIAGVKGISYEQAREMIPVEVLNARETRVGEFRKSEYWSNLLWEEMRKENIEVVTLYQEE
jgi:hypothetical protein